MKGVIDMPHVRKPSPGDKKDFRHVSHLEKGLQILVHVLAGVHLFSLLFFASTWQ